MIYFGIVEDRNDPLKLGRCKVRVVGLHSSSRDDISTEDLPWAYPVQPITSAGISGIGHAPVGLVEGSWVCIVFRDKEKQIPIILGSLGGIPTDEGSVEISYAVTNDLTVTPPTLIESYSSNVPDTVKSLTKFRETAIYVNPDNTIDPTNRVNTSTLDELNKMVNGIWQPDAGYYFIIGYGSSSVDGVVVNKGNKITEAKASEQLSKDLDVIFAKLQEIIRAPVTQSMMDALTIHVQDIGIDAFKQSSTLNEINTANYAQAAVSIQNATSTQDKQKRRAVEKTLFLQDGFPATPEAKPVQPASTSATQNAFDTPTGKYPLYKNEPDTNKLARHEDVGSTVVAFKETARVSGIKTGDGSTWDQPPIPYNADYPFNKVFATEAGHLMEFDDTHGSERIHLYHKTGTFTEIDCNGTQVNRIVGDSFEILERNGNVFIRGSSNVTVEGAKTLKVSGTMDVTVSGATNINILNDANINISGNANLAVGNTFNVKSPTIRMEANDIFMKSNGNFNVEATTATIKGDDVKVGGVSSLDLKTLGTFKAQYTSGIFGSTAMAGDPVKVSGTGLLMPPAKESASVITFSPLVVPTRTQREASNYEVPEDGDSSQYAKKRVATGSLPKAEAKPVKPSDVVKETPKLEKNDKQPPVSSCDLIFGMNDIPKNLQLSKNFNLLKLTANGSRPVVNQMGLTKQQIVCNMKGLCESCLEPILEAYPNMDISSGFRRPGDVPQSAPKSQHYNGQAADLIFKGFSKQQVYEAVLKIQTMIPFDQLILEYAGSSSVWIHVSFSYTSCRKQSFTMKNHVKVSDFGKYVLV